MIWKIFDTQEIIFHYNFNICMNIRIFIIIFILFYIIYLIRSRWIHRFSFSSLSLLIPIARICRVYDLSYTTYVFLIIDDRIPVTHLVSLIINSSVVLWPAPFRTCIVALKTIVKYMLQLKHQVKSISRPALQK